MAKKAAKKSAKSKPAGKKPAASAKKAKKPKKAAANQAKTAKMLADVRELVALMVANDVTEVHVEDGATKIRLRRGGAGDPETAIPSLALPAAGAPAPSPAAGAAQTEPEKDDLIDIPSPMVGTFYASASPESGPYVTTGASITDDTVVCILEAMKVMNEIKAECSGTIAEVCVSNAQPVEFGQVLFRVKPA